LPNVQAKNVANTGDIVKHAALLAMADLVGSMARGRSVGYLDTHAFQLAAPPADALHWSKETEDLAHVHHGYWRYLAAQRRTMPEAYLCSVGLALSALPSPRLFLFEKDSDTRGTLAAQLRDRGISPNHLGDDSLTAPVPSSHGLSGPLLALVDPFAESDSAYAGIWTASCRWVSHFHAPGEPGVIVAYRWNLDGAPIWGAPPAGFVGPIATIAAGGRHHLAVFTTEPLAGPALTLLRGLGWVACEVAPKSDTTEASSDDLREAYTVPTEPIALFDRYLMADYSGAKDEKVQRSAIVLCRAEREADNPLLVDTQFTRGTLRERLLDEIRGATKSGRRLLFGIDHQFSWPFGLLATCGLDHLSWRDVLMALGTGTYGGPALSHPAEFCAAFNAYALGRGHPAPFFSPAGTYGLPNQFQPRATLPFRETELALQRLGWNPKSATEIGVRGAVGGQTVLGMLELHRLHVAIKTEGLPVAFWPFDGASIRSPSYAGKHVGVEIYPTALRPRHWPPSDAADAIGATLASRDADTDGRLTEWLEVTGDHEAAAAAREGWILGCRASSRQVSSAFTEDPGTRSAPRPTLPLPTLRPTVQQQAVIQCEAPLVRVIARAGTGKTYTMVCRADRVLSEQPDAALLMLTFTRNGADEMRRRLIKLRRGLDRFEATTFHGLALRSLLTSPQTISIGDGLVFQPQRIRLLNEFDREDVLAYFTASREDLQLGPDWEDALSALINGTDPLGRQPGGLLDDHGGDGRLQAPGSVWRALLALYAREQLLDFDAVMVLFEYMLRTDAAFLDHSRRDFTHFIVDEFQDTNYPQLRSVEALAGLGERTKPRARQMMVVGDDFQTIYTWRGAVPGIFEELSRSDRRHGLSITTLGLGSSWRSSPDVLSLVNKAGRRLAAELDHASLAAIVPAEISPARPDLSGGAALIPTGRSALIGAVELLRGMSISDEEITVLSFRNDSALEARQTLEDAGIACDLVTARPSDSPGLRRFLLLLTAWIRNASPDFPTWWGVASEFANLDPRTFDALLEAVRLQPPNENSRTLGDLLGLCGPAFVLACADESPSQADGRMLERLLRKFRTDPFVDKEHLACERVIRILARRAELRSDPLRLIGEMTRKDFAGESGDVRRAIILSTIHQYKGLENRAVVLRYDFNPLDRRGGAERLRLDYVARSRAGQWLVAIDAPDSIVSDYMEEVADGLG
jgi:AAA domain